MSGGDRGGDRPSLMRSLGLFFGHVARGIRTKPGDDAPEGRTRHEVGRRVEVEERDGVVLRRTTIEEVELPAGRRPAPSPSDSDASVRPAASDPDPDRD